VNDCAGTVDVRRKFVEHSFCLAGNGNGGFVGLGAMLLGM